MKNILIQQGDVLLNKIDEFPKGLKRVKKDRRGLVLAEGEATGHCHAIKKVEDAVLYEKDGTLYLRVNKKTDLKHEEHNKIELSPGNYQIGIVQEYDHFEEEARDVMD